MARSTQNVETREDRGAYPHGDAIWEHKKGRVWLIVRRQENAIRALRYQNRVLQARLSRVPEGARNPFAGDR